MNEDMFKLITSSNHVSSGKLRLLIKLLATRGKALSLLQGVSRKRGGAQIVRDPMPDTTADSSTIGAQLSQFMQAPVHFTQKEAQKRRKTMGPLQFSQN